MGHGIYLNLLRLLQRCALSNIQPHLQHFKTSLHQNTYAYMQILMQMNAAILTAKGHITAATYLIRLSISTTRLLDTPNTFQRTGKCPQNCPFPGEDPDPPHLIMVYWTHLCPYCTLISSGIVTDRQTDTHGVYKSSLTNFQDAFLKRPRKYFTWQAKQYQNAGEVCNVWGPPYLLVLYWAGMLTPEITVILFTRGLPYAQCTKNHPTWENYIASYKIFQEHQPNSRRFPVFLEAISNSRRIPAVVDTSTDHATLVTIGCINTPEMLASNSQNSHISYNKSTTAAATFHTDKH